MIFSTVFTLTAVYFLFGFVAFVRDGIVARRKPTAKPGPVKTFTLIRPSLAKQSAGVLSVMGIRELRVFIRTAGLQESVRVTVGKNVSKCSKSELLQAIA